MEPPRHICEALYKLHKWARLGWVGLDRLTPDEPLNKGKFALIQLYAKRDADRTYYGDPWNDRGPIYGRAFDRLARVPIMLHLFDPQDVFSGKVVAVVREWMKPIGQRMLESAYEKGKEYERQFNELAEEMGEKLYWDSQRPDAARPPVVANKFLTEHDKAVLSGETLKGVRDTYTKNLNTGGQPLT